MKILFVDNTGLVSAGAFHSMVALIERLRVRGVEACVALPSFADGMDVLKNKGIRCFRFWPCSFSWMINRSSSRIEYLKMPLKNVVVFFGALYLAFFCKKNHVTIIHENTSACYIGYYAAKMAGIKHIWHVREFMEEDFNCEIWRKKRAFKFFSRSDAVIAVSQTLYKKYEGKINPHFFEMIYNGIDADAFFNPQRILFREDEVRILCVGRVSPAKGQMCLIEAVEILKKRGINIKVHLVGLAEGDYCDKVKTIVRSLQLENSVLFEGQQNDVLKFYNSCDIFCMCSRAEAFGRVTVEAMLSGCLVIGSASGGTAEIVQNDVTGMLFAPEDAKDLANKIMYALKNKDRMRIVAKEGQAYAYRNFKSEKNAEQIYNLYTRLV